MLAERSASLWAASPQRACHAIDAWASQSLLSGRAVARWAFQAPGFQSLDDELAVSIVWTALAAAMQRHETVLLVRSSLLQPPLLLGVRRGVTSRHCAASLALTRQGDACAEDSMPDRLRCRAAAALALMRQR